MESADNYRRLCDRVDAAAQGAGHRVRLLAVSKMQSAAAVRAAAAWGQTAFGENYVQEG
ncbi:MAG: YggS family pyridoxal phosphate-dependent enzyme, partial [Rudaea sp.]